MLFLFLFFFLTSKVVLLSQCSVVCPRYLSRFCKVFMSTRNIHICMNDIFFYLFLSFFLFNTSIIFVIQIAFDYMISECSSHPVLGMCANGPRIDGFSPLLASVVWPKATIAIPIGSEKIFHIYIYNINHTSNLQSIRRFATIIYNLNCNQLLELQWKLYN